MIVRILSGVFFTQLGVKERYLGYLNYLGLPWNIKFLWAPLVDGWSSKKRWQVALQGLIGLLTAFIGYLSYAAAASVDPSTQLQLIAYVFIVVAFLAASNDIAIYCYYL
jgi:PAT family beta-lactamase induction signal transducer AmpG